MSLCCLLNPVEARLVPLEKLLELSEFSINYGVKDGILNALQINVQSVNSKLSLTFTEPDSVNLDDGGAAPEAGSRTNSESQQNASPPPPHAGFDDQDEIMEVDDSDQDSDEDDDDEDDDDYDHEPEIIADGMIDEAEVMEMSPNVISTLLSISELHQMSEIQQMIDGAGLEGQMPESLSMHIAQALTRREMSRENDQRQRRTESTSSQRSLTQETSVPKTTKKEEIKDVFFSPDKVTAMRLSLIKVLIKIDSSESIIINQMLVHTITGIDINQPAQVTLLHEVIDMILIPLLPEVTSPY